MACISGKSHSSSFFLFSGARSRVWTCLGCAEFAQSIIEGCIRVTDRIVITELFVASGTKINEINEHWIVPALVCQFITRQDKTWVNDCFDKINRLLQPLLLPLMCCDCQHSLLSLGMNYDIWRQHKFQITIRLLQSVDTSHVNFI